MITKEQIYEAIPYLSASKIHTYLQCPSSFFFKYVLKADECETNDSYAKYGTLLHNIYEDIANGKFESVEEPIERYENEYGNCGLLDSQWKTYYEQGLQSIYNQWEFLHREDIEIIGAEVKFNCKPLDAPKFFGFVDLVYRDENGHLIVRDYKTSKKYTKQQLAKNIQAYFYSEACYSIYGEYPYAFEFEFVRFNDRTTIITNDEYVKFNKIRVQGIWNKIAKGIRTGKWTGFYCENFCSVRNSCPIYQAKKGGR